MTLAQAGSGWAGEGSLRGGLEVGLGRQLAPRHVPVHSPRERGRYAPVHKYTGSEKEADRGRWSHAMLFRLGIQVSNLAAKLS